MKNLTALLACSPMWAIRPEAVEAVVDLLSNGPQLRELAPESGQRMYAHTWEAAKPSFHGRAGSKIAIVPIQGVLTKSGPSWLGSSYDSISDAVESAANNPEVKRIVLPVNSPGGDVLGCPETAAVIAQAAKLKPVTAMVDGASASAAFWLTSQAHDINITPSGEIGSVGIAMLHMDISKKLEQEGVSVTQLHSGANKVEWSGFAPLSEEAKEDMQNRMDKAHGVFLNAVASGRGERATQQIRDARFGEGRMFSAADAMGHGLADAVISTRDFYRSLMPSTTEQDASAPAFPIRARFEIDKARADRGY